MPWSSVSNPELLAAIDLLQIKQSIFTAAVFCCLFLSRPLFSVVAGGCVLHSLCFIALLLFDQRAYSPADISLPHAEYLPHMAAAIERDSKSRLHLQLASYQLHIQLVVRLLYQRLGLIWMIRHQTHPLPVSLTVLHQLCCAILQIRQLVLR
jgi:hypothetical protein